jgi:pimeloyl-ACP methyl ester carboxylesterase
MSTHTRRPEWILAAAFVLALSSVAVSAQDLPTSAPSAPGRLIDVGGWRLHLYCTGPARSGQATVILEAGIGDFSVEWSLVQPKVAAFARVCSYDRADEGWSDYGPHPRTMHQIVSELHTLLTKAGMQPPYVLVGHSYGGWLVRLYRSQYPSEVVGLVLVEGGVDDPVRMLGDGKMRHASDLVTGKTIPEVKRSDPLQEASLAPDVVAMLTQAAARFGPKANEESRARLPADAQRARTWVYSQIKHWAQGDNPYEPEELAGFRAEHAANPRSYGDLPLIVLTRGLSEESGPDSNALEAEHRKGHEAQSQLSTNGRLIVAEKSGHHVQLDEPELVVTSIRETVVAATPHAQQ